MEIGSFLKGLKLKVQVGQMVEFTEYQRCQSFNAVFLKSDPTIAHGDGEIKDQGFKVLITLHCKHLSHRDERNNLVTAVENGMNFASLASLGI